MQYVYSEQLYHFGVPGMRWGHRKAMTADVYSKKIKKLRKLESRYTKYGSKAAELNYKAKSRFASANRRFFNNEERSARVARQSYRLEKRAAKAQRDSDRAKRKGIKLYKKLEKRMANATISDFNKEDLAYAQKFAARYIT